MNRVEHLGGEFSEQRGGGFRQGVLVALAAAVVAVAIGAGVSVTGAELPGMTSSPRSEAPTASSDSQAWLRALSLRSEALNRRQRQGVGIDTRSPAGATAAGSLRALSVRSDALNRKYGLGEYAAQP